MRGKDVLWQPGTDHAGIATQMVVERQLWSANEQPSRRELGRERSSREGLGLEGRERRHHHQPAEAPWRLVRLVRASASPWTKGLSKAVLKVFVQLYNEGLIYKDKRLVNWDPKFQTAISDLEVVQIEKHGTFRWAKASGRSRSMRRRWPRCSPKTRAGTCTISAIR